jgi:hypothetical protein
VRTDDDDAVGSAVLGETERPPVPQTHDVIVSAAMLAHGCQLGSARCVAPVNG